MQPMVSFPDDQYVRVRHMHTLLVAASPRPRLDNEILQRGYRHLQCSYVLATKVTKNGDRRKLIEVRDQIAEIVHGSWFTVPKADIVTRLI